MGLWAKRLALKIIPAAAIGRCRQGVCPTALEPDFLQEFRVGLAELQRVAAVPAFKIGIGYGYRFRWGCGAC